MIKDIAFLLLATLQFKLFSLFKRDFIGSNPHIRTPTLTNPSILKEEKIRYINQNKKQGNEIKNR